MAKAFGVLSLVTFVLSAGVHALTFVPGISVSMHLVWPLHLATMAACAAMVFVGQSIRKKNPKENSAELWSQVVRWVPLPLLLLCAASAAYTGINFSLFMGLMEGGSPAEKNGQYYLHNHGKKIRDLDQDEYERFRAYVVRGFSGHWMLFAVIPMTFFLYVYPAMRLGSKGNRESNAGDAAEPEAAPDRGGK